MQRGSRCAPRTSGECRRPAKPTTSWRSRPTGERPPAATTRPQGPEPVSSWSAGPEAGSTPPARDLYPRLAQDLPNHRISALRVQYRNPKDLVESAIDTVLGLRYLESQNVSAFGLVGHSLGGAAVIQAAANVPAARAVVAISTQTTGTEPVAGLAGRAAILLLHGDNDPVLPHGASEDVYRRAGEPKRLIIYEGAGHTLDEAAESLYIEVKAWLLKHLPGAVV